MTLDQAAIIQINATVIAGALVLLTINAAIDITDSALNRYAITGITIAIIMPFAASSFWAFDEKRLIAARQLTQYGFMVLLIGLVVFGLLVAVDQVRAQTENANNMKNNSTGVTAMQTTNTNPETWFTPDFWVAVGTAALAIATFLFLLETRKARIASQRPSFAIEPVTYDKFGNAKSINLVNNGQTASTIEATCYALDSPTGSGSSLTHHIMSLSKDGRVVIELPVELSEMQAKGQYLLIDIKCKDVENKDYDAKISFDYGKIKGTSIRVAYQYNTFLSMTLALKRVAAAAESIEKKFTKEKSDKQ